MYGVEQPKHDDSAGERAYGGDRPLGFARALMGGVYRRLTRTVPLACKDRRGADEQACCDNQGDYTQVFQRTSSYCFPGMAALVARVKTDDPVWQT